MGHDGRNPPAARPWLRSFRAKLVLSVASAIGVMLLLLGVCQLLWEALYTPGACASLGPSCDVLQQYGHLSAGWPLLVAVCLSALVGVLLVRRVTRPLSDLTAATRAIMAGDYTVRVAAQSDDEVGELAASMNDLVDALQRSERRRRELVSNVTHQMRTPLTSLEGCLEAIRDGVRDADASTLERLQRQAARLRRLVTDLGRLADAERLEERPVELVRIELGGLLEEVVEVERQLFEARGVALELRLPAEPLPVAGHQHGLIDLFANLLDNARRHTDAGGRVTVSAARRNGSVAVTVADTGSGIRPEDLPHVFERFYRAGDGPVAGGGSGIGLAVVDHVVRAHRGQARVVSEVGRGSTFEVLLPRLRERGQLRSKRVGRVDDGLSIGI